MSKVGVKGLKFIIYLFIYIKFIIKVNGMYKRIAEVQQLQNQLTSSFPWLDDVVTQFLKLRIKFCWYQRIRHVLQSAGAVAQSTTWQHTTNTVVQ